MSRLSEPGENPSPLLQPGMQPRLSWDIGTAYDLFVSLAVLHNPDNFGLRASWAAGVRSRLPAAERKILEDLQPSIWIPLHWIQRLPEPKDAASALAGLHRLPPQERLQELAQKFGPHQKGMDILQEVSARGGWRESDLESLRSALHSRKDLSRTDLISMLDCWAHPAESGELYLAALQSYVQVFFAEEEKRIAPLLRAGLEQAQERAGQLSLPALLAELSQGVHFEEGFYRPEVTLAPTYWSTPLVIFAPISSERLMVLFGVRPADMALVPGEIVPDALIQALKALADPTRLRILRYLASETLTPSELSRRLRLRAPTVTHHLNALRLAGLVHLNLQPDGERRYAARLEGIESTFSSLNDFLANGSEPPRPDEKT